MKWPYMQVEALEHELKIHGIFIQNRGSGRRTSYSLPKNIIGN